MIQPATNDLQLERISAPNENGECPVQAVGDSCPVVSRQDDLVLPKHRRTVVQYSTNEAGATELRLYYGAKEISFDEPDLFAFGETLAKQSRFTAGDATGWGHGYDWPQVRDL